MATIKKIHRRSEDKFIISPAASLRIALPLLHNTKVDDDETKRRFSTFFLLKYQLRILNIIASADA